MSEENNPNIIHYGENPEPEQKIRIQLENKTEQSKEELWQEMKSGVIDRYKERGINFDADTIQNKADLDNAARVLMEMDNKDKIEAEMTKKLPHGGETANYYSPAQQGTKYPSDNEGLPVDMLSAETPEQLITILNSRKDPDAKLALNKLNSKVVRSQTGLDFQFEGSSKDFLRHEKTINEFDSEELKQQKQALMTV